jgi:hypothetical protein
MSTVLQASKYKEGRHHEMCTLFQAREMEPTDAFTQQIPPFPRGIPDARGPSRETQESQADLGNNTMGGRRLPAPGHFVLCPQTLCSHCDLALAQDRKPTKMS